MIFPENVFLSPKNDFISASGADLIKSRLMRHFGLLEYTVLRFFLSLKTIRIKKKFAPYISINAFTILNKKNLNLHLL